MRATIKGILSVVVIVLGLTLVVLGLWSGSITLNSVIAALIAAATIIGILCAWALLCFLYFRHSRSETPDRLREFLESHFDAFAWRVFDSTPDVITRESIQQFSLRGWTAGLLPILAYRGDSIIFWMLSLSLLFFGGLLIGWSWYAIRSLRLLGLQSYAKAGAEPNAAPNGGPAASAGNSNAPGGPPSVS